MRRFKAWKRLLAMAMAASVFMTDQSMIYAAKREDVPEAEAFELEQILDMTDLEEISVLYAETVWRPQDIDFLMDIEKEELLFEQPYIASEEEPYLYENSYGNQLEGTLAGELYKKLETLWENDNNSSETKEEELIVFLGNIGTEAARLEGEEYEEFCFSYEKAAQNSFDAFFYDYADADRLDVENCSLTVYYEGTQLEKGSCQWSARAIWDLVLKEEITSEEENEVEADDAELFQTLERIYGQVTEAWEKAGDPEAVEGEVYARMFKKRCEQAGIECVLVKGILDGRISVWNAVRMEDGNWYAVDVGHSVFLAGSGDGTEGEGFGASHTAYGDFSNSHMGTFVYPQLAEADYILPETDGSDITYAEEAQTQPEEDGLEENLPSETEDTISSAFPAAEDTELSTLLTEEPVAEDTLVSTFALEETTTAGQSRAAAEKVLTQISVSSIKTQTYTGKAITPKITVKDKTTNKKLKAGTQYTVSYENNVNAGTATIVIRGVAGSGYDGALRIPFTIQKQDIAKKVAAKVNGKFTYTGDPVTPGVNVTFNKAGLVQGRDYRISYTNNVQKGTAQIQLTGIGNFTGTKVLKFKISSRQMKEAQAVLSSYSGVYAGNAALPEVTVTCGGKTCQKNVDYKVTYPKQLKVGKNTITVKGAGNFTGSVKLTYTVTKASLGSAKVNLSYAWKYTGKNLQAVPSSVKVNGVSLQAKKDYTIQYRASNGKTSNSIKAAGDYKVILTGKGNYQGTLVFDICVTSDGTTLNQNYNTADETTKPVPLPDTSPGDKVPVDHDEYFGYYEGYKVYSKKGIQGVSAYTEDLGVQHVLLNVDMSTLISPGKRSGYVPYTYKGKTYYFGDLIALKNTIYYLHGWGTQEQNPYGNHMRNVTLVLLMSWKDELSYLIHPSARKKGAAPYYALNMQDASAKDTFEALFRYMGEELGQYKYRVNNWTLGNEVNSCKAWNYSGGMSLQNCVSNYAQAFQLLYKGVQRCATSSRVFISLDHCWTAVAAGHGGKEFLDQFAVYMNQTAPLVRWNVNYHPYSANLKTTDFWTDTSSTSDIVDTKYISMGNIKVLTDYLSGIESRYGKAANSIRVIIGELGYTATQGNDSSEAKQAAALGYGYYIAMFNTRIDSYIIRAYLDDPAEIASGLYLGLRNKNHEKKDSYDVYKYLDTAEGLERMNRYLTVVGLSGSSWEKAIPGFDANALPAKDF